MQGLPRVNTAADHRLKACSSQHHACLAMAIAEHLLQQKHPKARRRKVDAHFGLSDATGATLTSSPPSTLMAFMAASTCGAAQ